MLLSSADTSVQLLVEESWLVGAVVSSLGPEGYTSMPGPVQVLDLSSNPLGNGLNCVLSDRMHSIGAVLCQESIDLWRSRYPMGEWLQLNGTIILPSCYKVAINECHAQFILQVKEFAVVDRRPRPDGGKLTIGSPRPVMADRKVCEMFDLIMLQRGRVLVERALLPYCPTMVSANLLCHLPAACSCLLWLQQYATPMECASLPVQSIEPHRLLPRLIAVPLLQQRMLHVLLQEHPSAPRQTSEMLPVVYCVSVREEHLGVGVNQVQPPLAGEAEASVKTDIRAGVNNVRDSGVQGMDVDADMEDICSKYLRRARRDFLACTDSLVSQSAPPLVLLTQAPLGELPPVHTGSKRDVSAWSPASLSSYEPVTRFGVSTTPGSPCANAAVGMNLQNTRATPVAASETEGAERVDYAATTTHEGFQSTAMCCDGLSWSNTCLRCGGPCGDMHVTLAQVLAFEAMSHVKQQEDFGYGLSRVDIIDTWRARLAQP